MALFSRSDQVKGLDARLIWILQQCAVTRSLPILTTASRDGERLEGRRGIQELRCDAATCQPNCAVAVGEALVGTHDDAEAGLIADLLTAHQQHFREDEQDPKLERRIGIRDWDRG